MRVGCTKGLAVTELWRYVVVKEQCLPQIRRILLMSRTLCVIETILQPLLGFWKALRRDLPKSLAVVVQRIVRHASERYVPKLH